MFLTIEGQEWNYLVHQVIIQKPDSIMVEFEVLDKDNNFLHFYGFTIPKDQIEMLFTKWDIDNDIFKIVKQEEDTEYRDKIYRAHNNFILVCDAIRTALGMEITRTKLGTEESQALLEAIKAVDAMAAIELSLKLLACATDVTTIGSSWYHIVWHPEIEE